MRVYRNLYLLPKLMTVPVARPRPLEHMLRIDPFRSNSSVTNALGANVLASHESALSMVTKLSDRERETLRQALAKFESSKLVSHQLEGKISWARVQFSTSWCQRDRIVHHVCVLSAMSVCVSIMREVQQCDK